MSESHRFPWKRVAGNFDPIGKQGILEQKCE
jgi:hypothetical protein